MAPAAILVDAPQRKKGSSATNSSGSSARSKSSSLRSKSARANFRAKKSVKINVFVQTDWMGECVKVDVLEDVTMGELKKSLCTEHGFLPGEHFLLGPEGVPLDDVLTLPDCGITANATLQLANRSKEGLVSPRKRKPMFLEEEEEEEEEVESFRASEEELEKAIRVSLKKSLTKGGMHVQELASPKKNSRENARKRAQDKAMKLAEVHQKNSDASHQDLASMASNYAQQLFAFPSMFLNCTPEVAKRQPAWGGA